MPRESTPNIFHIRVDSPPTLGRRHPTPGIGAIASPAALKAAGSQAVIGEAAGDKGYHAAAMDEIAERARAEGCLAFGPTQMPP